MSKLSQFEILEELGKGTYGRVYKVRRRTDNAILVRKQVTLEGMSDEDREETLNEARVMSKCDHFNIIKYYESFIEDKNLHIIMEYASGGDLSKKIRAQNMIPFQEEILWNYLIQCSQGLQYLHKQRILHRDIKPQNIFLDKHDNIKIGDMGLGRILGPQSNYAYTGVGTPLYFSPELCTEKPYNQKGDIWAFGCLLYELACFKPPFIASNQLALAKKICNEVPAPLPPSVPKDLQFLIFKMLEKDPHKRPDIEQILNYSGVKIRIQKAKLRHQELKMQEEYAILAKKMKEEYEVKCKTYEATIDQQLRQILEQKKIIDQQDREINAIHQENKILNERIRLYEEEKMRQKAREAMVATSVVATPQHPPQYPNTPPRDRTPSPSKRANLVGDSPNSKYYSKGTTSDLKYGLENLETLIEMHKLNAIMNPDKRPKSAPNTPDRSAKQRIIKPSTPGPATKMALQLLSPHLPEISAYHLGLCSEKESRMARMPPFPKLFSWTRSLRAIWKNEAVITLSENVVAMILVYRVDINTFKTEAHKIKQILVYSDNQKGFRKVIPRESKVMKASRNSFNYPDPRIVLEVALESSKCVTRQVMIQFDNPSAIREVIILKHNLKFLELAGVVPIKIPQQFIQPASLGPPTFKSPPRVLLQQQQQEHQHNNIWRSNQEELIIRTPGKENNKPQLNSNLVNQILEGIIKRKNGEAGCRNSSVIMSPPSRAHNISVVDLSPCTPSFVPTPEKTRIKLNNKKFNERMIAEGIAFDKQRQQREKDILELGDVNLDIKESVTSSNSDDSNSVELLRNLRRALRNEELLNKNI